MKEPKDSVIDPETELAVATIESGAVPEVAQRNFNGINVGGNTVTQSTAHLDEELRTIVRAIFTVSRQNKWTWDKIKAATGISGQFFYALWTGRYFYPAEVTEKYCPHCKRKVEKVKPGGSCPHCERRDVQVTKKPHPKAGLPIPFNADTIKALRNWKARQDQTVKEVTDFAPISVWKRIEVVARRAFKHKRMFFVIGEPQSGKTRSARELARVYNSGQTTYVDTPPSPGKQLMLKVLAKALDVANTTCFDKLLMDVIEALDPSKQIVFDNFHRVLRTYQRGSVVGCMDTILYIYDQTGCSMGIFATPQFQKEMREGEFRQYLKQFDRRGVYELRLEDEPKREDLDLIAARYDLNPATGEAEKVMKEIAHVDGLGKFCTRLADAADLADAKRETLEWKHFVKAHNIALKLATRPTAEKVQGEEEEAR